VTGRGRAAGQLALVLHTHMPLVTGFGTWPFGEEWLWEAVAASYLRILDSVARAPITLSLTPVLADQLEDPQAQSRCLHFLRTIRPESHRRDAARYAERGHSDLVAELERSADEYAAAAVRLAGLPGGLIAALAPAVSWTSSATHAILPLLVSETCVSVQLHTGIASHRRRFGDWGGGLWLPECAHAAWLDPELLAAGVHATCVELTGRFGCGDARHLQPLLTRDGPLLWPLDRWAIALVWSPDGYPAAPAYRDYHARTEHHHRVWRNDGAAYDDAAARGQAAEHARDFVARVAARVRDGGVCVCALDTELLGHWWYEGPWWLEGVIEEAARQGLALTTLDDALARAEPVPAPDDLAVSSWGEGGDLRTWSGPGVADLAWQARSAELALLATGSRPPDRALRELLALQSSDWAFLAHSGTAGDYPRERARGHAEALATALAGGAGSSGSPTRGGRATGPQLGNLAPDLAGWLI
jgi:1,4-alpha-glucan branching enzyme